MDARYRVITLSGEAGSGKSSIARSLAGLLPGWQTLNTGERFRRFCASEGMSIQQVSELADEVHIQFDQEQQRQIAAGSNLIVEGRLAGWVAREMAHVFRVWCQAPLHVRVMRLAAREHISTGQAYQDLEDRDRKDLEKYRRVYRMDDYRAPKLYHLVLDTSWKTPDELAGEIVERAGLQTET